MIPGFILFLEQKNNFVYIAILSNQAEPVQLTDMLLSGRLEIDSGGVDGAVSQDVGQLYKVAAAPVEHRGEQMPQVVRKNF